MKARPHDDDLLATVHRDGDFPPALAQRLLQLLHSAHVACEPCQMPFQFERIAQPPQVPRRVVHVGRLHLDIVQTHDRVDRDIARFGRLAHHLVMHLTFRRDVDDDVPLDARLT